VSSPCKSLNEIPFVGNFTSTLILGVRVTIFVEQFRSISISFKVNFAATLLGNVFRKGIMADVQTFSAIVDRFCIEGMLSMAKSTTRFHGSSGVDPDVSILHINY